MRNNIDVSKINKKLKDLQDDLGSHEMSMITLVVGFATNIITIIISLLQGYISQTCFIILSSILIGILGVVIIINIYLFVRSRVRLFNNFTKKQLCQKFEDNVIDNVDCAMEYYEESQVNSVSVNKNYLKNESCYHLSVAIDNLIEIIRYKSKVIDTKIISQKRISAVFDVMSSLKQLLSDGDVNQKFEVLEVMKTKNKL